VQKKQEYVERNLVKQPLTEDEVKALAKRLGGVRELVAPKKRAELEKLTDAALVKNLAANPGNVRRPLIDTGKLLTAGFTAKVKETLEK
jgi:arsenate reductase